MKSSDMMKSINKLIDKGITEICKSDVEYLEWGATENTQFLLQAYCDCEVTKVADLFNVKLPQKKYTREQIKNQKMWENIIG